METMGYYSAQELRELNIKFGKNVLISKKSCIYSNQLEIGNNVRIDDFCILVGNIKIGSFVHIAAYCQLSGSSGIIIEDFCGIASRALLYSRTDDFSGVFMTGPLIDHKYTNVKKGKILIQRHSIIGAGSIILPQVKLAYGTAVGALSLIDEDTEEWSMYVGVPAKKIKERNKDILNLEQKFLKEKNNS